MDRIIWSFRVLVGNECIADGFVIANTKQDAEQKVKIKYDNVYEKVEIDNDDNGEYGTQEDKEIEGLFVRWED